MLSGESLPLRKHTKQARGTNTAVCMNEVYFTYTVFSKVYEVVERALKRPLSQEERASSLAANDPPIESWFVTFSLSLSLSLSLTLPLPLPLPLPLSP